MARLIESGCSVVVGTVAADGTPEADRAFGQWVLSGPERLRFLVPASSARTLANLADGGPVALTFTVIATLQSIQVKGHATCIEPPTADDLALHARYAEEFPAAINEVEGTPFDLLLRLKPDRVVAVECTVESLFDQTPGPTAGRCLS